MIPYHSLCCVVIHHHVLVVHILIIVFFLFCLAFTTTAQAFQCDRRCGVAEMVEEVREVQKGGGSL